MIDLIFVALAVILALKLKQIFGQEYDVDVNSTPRKNQVRDITSEAVKMHKEEDSISSHESVVTIKIPSHEEIIQSIEPHLMDKFAQIQFHNPLVNPVNFVETCKEVILMLFSAYTRLDYSAIETLTSSQIASNFEESIRAKQTHNVRDNVVVIKFIKTKITDISSSKEEDRVRLTLVSEQLNYVTDLNNKVISGSDVHATTVYEDWTFSKQKESNAQWKISDVTTHAK